MSPVISLAERATASTFSRRRCCRAASVFRNRVAFEPGVKQLGGEPIYILGRLGEREAVEDIARYLSNWFDTIVIRAPEYQVLEQMARAARVPIINARTRRNHPCEILGDLAFVREVKGSLTGLTVVFVGEPTNLCHSWFEAAVRFPIQVIQVCPSGYEVNGDYVRRLMQDAVGTVTSTQELDSSLRSADVVYTDCWPSRHDEESCERIARDFGA